MLSLTAPATELKPWSRRRRAGFDRRTRGFKRWTELRAALEGELGRAPTPSEATLLDSAADLMLAAEVMRGRLTAGRLQAEELVRTGSELRRLRRALGLEDGNGAAETGRSLGDLLGGEG